MVQDTKWTHFWDMHSGGGTKEPPYENIYIEATEDEAKLIFYNRFGHNPDRVSCTCCGNDYSISESDTIEQATGFHRNCDWSEKEEAYIEKKNESSYYEFKTVSEYEKETNVLFIRAAEIEPNERIGELPEEGYVWR